jgi:malate dehydrogenase (oxaloacetate-decarboxylating)(NADP+)
VTPSDLEHGRIYPALKDIREISVRVTIELVKYMYKAKLATVFPEPADKEQFVRSQLYCATGQNNI